MFLENTYLVHNRDNLVAMIYNFIKSGSRRGAAGGCARSGDFGKDQGIGPFTYDGIKMGPSGADFEKCIYYVTDVPLQHSKAELACKANVVGACGAEGCPGSLVTIHTDFQNGVLIGHMVTDHWAPSWTGARLHCAECGFEWNDHSPFDYSYWGPGEPNNALEGEHCVEMDNYNGPGYWNDNNCNTQFNYFCQAYVEKAHPIPSGDEKWVGQGNCKEGWVKYAKAEFNIRCHIFHDFSQNFLYLVQISDFKWD